MNEYVKGEVQRVLTEDPSVAEQGLRVVWRGSALVLSGEVESGQRRDQIAAVVAERFPDVPLVVDIGVLSAPAPATAEPERIAGDVP